MSELAHLATCPFCGGTAEITQHHKDFTWSITHRCKTMPSVSTPWSTFETTVDNWNRRAPSPLVKDFIAAAEGAQVMIEAYFTEQGRDPCNSDNYCRLLDFLKAARHAEKKNE